MYGAVQTHFRGLVENMKWSDASANFSSRDAVALRVVAKRAMNYFLRTPRPHLGYACRFGNGLGACPPGPSGEDLVANGDTDVRMETVLAGLREVSGVTDEPHVDEGLHRRIMSYVAADDLSRMPYAACCSNALPPDALVVSPWTTGWTIRSLTDRWQRMGDVAAREQARRMALALKSLASWETGRAYFPSAVSYKGHWVEDDFGAVNYCAVVCDLLHYATAAGDDEILEFGRSLAHGIVDGLQPRLGVNRFREDGSFTGHTHLHTRALWGVAMAGRIFRDPMLLEWARRGYEFVRSCGTDFGWFPERTMLRGEHPNDGYEDRVDVSETCVTGDMTQTAAELARAGYPRYWDHVERYVMNYLPEVQFALTPRVEQFYRSRNAALPAVRVQQGLAMLRDYEGGFLSDVGVNDWVGPAMGPLNMAGCCVPEGARAVVAASHGAVVRENACVKVNLNLSHQRPMALVRAGNGGMLVTAVEGRDYMLRPPAWTQRDNVIATRRRKSVPVEWRGDYVHFSDVQIDEELSIHWPVPRFVTLVDVGGRRDRQHPYTIFWEGNRVVGIMPEGTDFPMFTGRNTSY